MHLDNPSFFGYHLNMNRAFHGYLMLLAVASLLFFPFLGFGQSEGIKVITTLFPLYDMARYIGSGAVEVSLLLPAGADPHHFEPRPSDIIKVAQATCLIYTRMEMEPWVRVIIKGLKDKDMDILLLEAGKGVRILAADPHIWLDPENAQTMVDNICQALICICPQHRDLFKKNAVAYKAKLSELDSVFSRVLKGCKNKTIVYAGHQAFGYLARRYDLELHCTQGPSPDAEPTAKEVARLIDEIKKKKIRYVFYEERHRTKVAKTIAQETGAELIPLHPGGTLTKQEFAQGVSFFDILLRDLEGLKKGLACP